MNIYSTHRNCDKDIGKIITVPIVIDFEGNPHYNVRMMVMRRATQEEYLAQPELRNPNLGPYYYVGSTD